MGTDVCSRERNLDRLRREQPQCVFKADGLNWWVHSHVIKPRSAGWKSPSVLRPFFLPPGKRGVFSSSFLHQLSIGTSDPIPFGKLFSMKLSELPHTVLIRAIEAARASAEPDLYALRALEAELDRRLAKVTPETPHED